VHKSLEYIQLVRRLEALEDLAGVTPNIPPENDLKSGWRDNFANIAGQPTGVNAPTMTAFGPTGNIKQPAFATAAGGDSVYIIWHIDHDVEPGSTCYMHVHWTTNGTSTNKVKWEIRYTFAKGHNQSSGGNFPAETLISLEESASGVAWRHMVTEDAVGITVPEPDSLVVAEVKRVVASGAANADTVFGLFVDIHYQADRIATVNRSPNFYG
jgi:hypothetical protein